MFFTSNFSTQMPQSWGLFPSWTNAKCSLNWRLSEKYFLHTPLLFDFTSSWIAEKCLFTLCLEQSFYQYYTCFYSHGSIEFKQIHGIKRSICTKSFSSKSPKRKARLCQFMRKLFCYTIRMSFKNAWLLEHWDQPNVET